MPETDLTHDHAELSDAGLVRRYFAKFDRITAHLAEVAAELTLDHVLTRTEARLIGSHVTALRKTFAALTHKYMFAGRTEGPLTGRLTFDRVESGFPVFAELMSMANDAQQAAKHLASMPSAAEMKDEMVRQIVGSLTVPLKLQFALSQRLYYEGLAAGGLFWGRNDPDALWQGDVADARRHYLVHWSVYDSGMNLPVLYLMNLEDSGPKPLPLDQHRWPEAQAHLMAQSLGGLKLLTIAHGFDRDFADLHPKRLRRIHLGPMYSAGFTLQSGPIREVLDQAKAPEGEDWALAWTVEDLLSERVEQERAGWFGMVDREIFALDPFAGRGADTGATRTERSLILPQRPYQVLAELNPPGFHGVRKFVVSPGGRVLSYR